MSFRIGIHKAIKPSFLPHTLIAAAITFTLATCNKSEEEPRTPIAPPSKELALKMLQERQAADGDKVMSAVLKSAPDRRFAGTVTIKSKSGELKDWNCNIRPPQIGQPIGTYSCYLNR